MPQRFADLEAEHVCHVVGSHVNSWRFDEVCADHTVQLIGIRAAARVIATHGGGVASAVHHGSRLGCTLTTEY